MKVGKRLRRRTDGTTWWSPCVDYYDFGKRRVRVFDTKREAEDFLAKLKKAAKQRAVPKVDPHITLDEYAKEFRRRCEAQGLRTGTLERIEGALRVHVLPEFGRGKVRDLDRHTIRAFLESKLTEDVSRQGQKVRP